jgi:hypothetical protein
MKGYCPSAILKLENHPVAGVHVCWFNDIWRSWDNSVGIATSYVLDDRDSIPFTGKRFLSTPQRPDRLRVSPSLSYNGYQGLFPGD